MTEKIGQLARTYWPMIVAALALAAAWGTSTTQIGWVLDGNRAIIARLDKQSDQIAAVNAAIASTQATSIATTANIDDLRERMRNLEARAGR